jgi:hypothetical protein
MGKEAFDCFEAEVETCAEILKDITDKMEGLVPVSMIFPSPSKLENVPLPGGHP